VPSQSWIFDREFVPYVVLTLALALIPGQSTALAAHMTWQGFAPASFGLVIAVNGILIITLQPTISGWAAQRDPTRMLAIAALLYGAGFAIHGIAHSVAIHAAAVMVWTLGEILEAPTRSSVVAAMAPTDARGRYQGAIAMAFGAALLAGPKLGTWTWQRFGPSVLWASCLVLGIVVSLVLLATGPARRRRMATSP
jgi:MFS family permease